MTNDAAPTHGRNYPLLLASLFLSGFADNAMLSVMLGPLTSARAAGTLSEQGVSEANALYAAMFFIPFLLFAPVAGFLNDRYPKTRWLLGGSLIRIVGALVGVAGVAWGHNWHAAAYAIAGVGACCYSPAKYGLLPEVVPAARLVKANGTVEMLTLGGILTGLGAGAKLVDTLPVATCYGIVAGMYALAAVLALFMARTPQNAAARLSHSVGEFLKNLRGLALHPRLGRVLFGTGLFWFCGATLRSNLQAWGLNMLGGDGADITNTRLVWLKLALALGIIVGSVVVGQLHRLGDLRGVRWYAWLIALTVLPLGFLPAGAAFALIVTLLAGVGAAAGLFLIPLNATIQHETDPRQLGKTIAVQNFVDYAAMLVGAGFVFALSKAGMNSAQVFIALALAVGAIAFLLHVPAKAGKNATTNAHQ